jgi:hypothetical protein
MEEVAGQKVYYSEGCGLERVGNKGGEDCGIEFEAESKPHDTVNLFRRIPSGVVKSVSKKRFGIKICSEETQLPLWCTIDRFSRPTILHSK